MSNDQMPHVGEYRGVRIHAFQSEERIEGTVKPEIDAVHIQNDMWALFEYANSPMNPPEARIFAAAKYRAARQIAGVARSGRPGEDDADVMAASV